jgi:hypothetical protein
MKLVISFAIVFFITCVNVGMVAAVSSSDVSVWQGQYYKGTEFQIGTYEFNFTVYDALIGGNICYSNTTTLTTGNFGEWKTEQSGVSTACNNVSKNYYLNININGVDQTPRRRLVVWNSLRKDVDEVSTGNLVLHGTLSGLSPLKLQDEINFIGSDGMVTSALYNAPREAPSTLPSVFADSLIHDIISETNDYGMQECWWDENTETVQMCISGAYLAQRATTISRSLQVVGNPTSKPINENFTMCEGNDYVDCNPDTTGADLLVEDDIESIGSIFSQENVTASDTGFFNYLGSLVNRITKLFVQDIDATGNIETSQNVSANYFKGDGSLLTNLPAGGGESDPVWAANSSTVARTGNCPAGQVVQNTTTVGVQCMTPAAAASYWDRTGTTLTPATTGDNINTTGKIQGKYYSNDGSQGMTDTTSYWICTDNKCKNFCQLQIKNGLIIGCS